MTPEKRFLCEVSIELAADAPPAVGATPWRNRRASDIKGGTFDGPGLSGNVRQSSADWSEGGRAVDGGIATALDVRSLWQTHDGGLIYVSYGGRLVIPAEVSDEFLNPEALETLEADRIFQLL